MASVILWPSLDLPFRLSEPDLACKCRQPDRRSADLQVKESGENRPDNERVAEPAFAAIELYGLFRAAGMNSPASSSAEIFICVSRARAGAGAIRIVRWTEHPRRGTRTCAIVVADSAERGHSARPGEGGTG